MGNCNCCGNKHEEGEGNQLQPLIKKEFSVPREVILLCRAAESGDVEAVQSHVAEYTTLHINEVDEMGCTPLLRAVMYDHYMVASLLLDLGAGPSVHIGNPDGFTPMHAAAENGNKNMVSLLAKHGADSNARTLLDLTPLHVAAQENKLEMVACLCYYNKANVNINYKERRISPLMSACERGHTNVAALLIKNDAYLDAQDEDGNSPLSLACQNGHVRTAELLLRNIDLRTSPHFTSKLMTPLHLAVENGYTDVVQLLIEKHADVNAQDKVGKTPLHYASQKGFPLLVKLLFKSGADLNIRDKNTSAEYPEGRIAKDYSRDTVQYPRLLQAFADCEREMLGGQHQVPKPINYIKRQLQDDSANALNNTLTNSNVAISNIPAIHYRDSLESSSIDTDQFLGLHSINSSESNSFPGTPHYNS